MKFGFHCYILTKRWSDDALPILDRTAALGADCVEIALGDDVHFSPQLTRSRAASLGLTLVASPGGAWPVECDLSADDPAHRARGLAWHQRQLDTAAALGAVAYTGALYGHPGTVLRRIPPADESARAAAGLHALAAYGASRGIEVVLEPMSHFRTHVANTPAQAMRLIEMADHPNLKVLLDTYHMVTEVRDYGQAVREAQGRLWGLHACENDRGAPGGGLVPWDDVFSALCATGFDGYVILESYNSALDGGQFAFGRGMFHDVCPDGEAFIRDGLAFTRAGLSAEALGG